MKFAQRLPMGLQKLLKGQMNQRFALGDDPYVSSNLELDRKE
ncbi:hypothetical protein UF75_5073 [Desulfosporosinus sp. I2]|nr:hypothetical protein UF75_5073 [Desulfosporosinus sp. I2]